MLICIWTGLGDWGEGIFMENWKLYVDLGYGVPQYAVMEILRAMQNDAKPVEGGSFGYCVKCNDGFGVGNNRGLGMCLMANSRCVGLELTDLQFEPDGSNGKLVVSFNKR